MSAAGTIVFASDRSGNFELYSIRADGKLLGQLTRSPEEESWALFSPDGRQMVFGRGQELWLANADGSHLRRLGAGNSPDWSPDSRRIAYTATGHSRANLSPLYVAGLDGRSRLLRRGRNDGPHWSPDGKLIAFDREVTVGTRFDLLVVGSNGRGLRTVRRRIFFNGVLDWSAAGQITFVNSGGGIDVIRADGRGHRQLIRGRNARGFAWSSDGKRFAFVDDKRRLRVVAASGQGARDITPRGARLDGTPAWSPDGRWIAIRSLPAGATHADIVRIATNGSSSRRITSRAPLPWGSENLEPTWRPRRSTPARLGLRPVKVSSEVFSRKAFQPPVPGKITGLAAYGTRAAVITQFARGCASVEVWDQARARVVRPQRPCGPNDETGAREGTDGVALAASRVGWRHLDGGNSLEMSVRTAPLTTPRPITVASGVVIDEIYGEFASAPVGHEALIAFTVGQRCDANGTENGHPQYQCPPGRSSGDVIDATIWRYGGRGTCPSGTGSCERVAQASGDLTVLAVDRNRIAARTDAGVQVLGENGASQGIFPVSKPVAAALSGSRLAVETAAGVAVYQMPSPLPVTSFPGVRLADMEGDLLLLSSGSTLTIRGLTDGRTLTVRTSGAARGQLEPPGLFAAGSRRVTFTPMSELRRRLG